MRKRPGATSRIRLWKVEGSEVHQRSDSLATEEPMEIRLEAGGEKETVAITMRTPGDDFELAAGFFYAEGILTSRGQVDQIAYCLEPGIDAEQRYNIVTVRRKGTHMPDLRHLERHFFTSSACGVCGRGSLDALELRGVPDIPAGPEVSAQVLKSFPETLREAQGVFEATGGLHAAALFDSEGNLIELREDVGRHNAVDKLVGWALLEDQLPLDEHILMVSGRASFEILQKALMASIPFVCAVSAPSNLAVRLAHRFGVTLVGFLREDRFNVYHGVERVGLPEALPR